MQYCYCLFCETNKCKKVPALLEKKGIGRAISPQIVKRQRKDGKNIDVIYDLLPGYVFAYSDSPVKEFSQLRVEGVIKLLGSPENSYCLRNEDQSFALRLLEKNGLIDVINLIRVGDFVTLADELFSGCEGQVTKIDYRKQRAKLSFSFSKMHFSTWVACEVIHCNLSD